MHEGALLFKKYFRYFSNLPNTRDFGSPPGGANGLLPPRSKGLAGP